MSEDERVRSVLAKGARLVELHTRAAPPAGTREDLDAMAWLTAVRSVEATPATMRALQEDCLLALIAAHRMGYLEGLREGEGGTQPGD